MKSSPQTDRKWLRGFRPAGLAAALILSITSLASLADDGKGIFPPGSSPYGKTYSQWTAAWWQWALSVPAANNPWLDTTGAYASVGQSGPVWFLGYSPGTSVERTFTIPGRKGIFLPVYAWIFGSCAGDCDPSNPGVTCDVPTLQASAAAAATSVQTMEVRIDGHSVFDLSRFHATSQGGFSVTLPDANVPMEVFGLPTPAGTYFPQVADGYWLMFQPLEPGRHTIRVHIIPDPSYGSEQFVTFHITVLSNQDNQGNQDN